MSLPSRYEIAKYWIEGEGRNSLYVKVYDTGEPICFACGYHAEYWDRHKLSEEKWNKSSLDRAHIKPKSLGGSDTVDNLVLLCSRCHKEAPDYVDSKEMLNWISVRPHWLNHRSATISQELELLGISNEQLMKFVSQKNVAQSLLEFSDRIGTHAALEISSLKATTIALLVRDAIHANKEVTMLEIRLETEQGEFVETIDLPPFEILPEGLIWGNRAFLRHDGLVYREISYYVVKGIV